MLRDILYKDNIYTLLRGEHGLILLYHYDKLQVFELTSHYYEPCTYVEDEGGFRAVLHSAFDLSFVVKDLEENKDIVSALGTFTPQQFCKLMVDSWYKQRSETKQEIAKESGFKTARR